MLDVKVWLVVLISSFSFYIECRDFHVEGSGHFPVEEEDIGIRFYLTIVSNEKVPIDIVKAHEPECCWEVEPGDIDCASMELFGGFPAKLNFGEKVNITYVFSNIYPLDRVGSCKFHLKKEGGKAIVHEIPFNTSTRGESKSWMRELFEGGPEIYVQCKGVDENPRNYCQPFHCAKKYNGYRNFFNWKTYRCEPVNSCRTELGNDNLPTSAFDLDYNRCKSLIHDTLTEEEKKVSNELLSESPLEDELNAYEDVNPNDMVIDCKNGVQEGRFCRCKKGWKTVSVTTIGGGVMMDWCSKKVKIKKKTSKPNKTFKIVILILLCCLCVALLFLVFYLWWKLFLSEVLVQKGDGKEATTSYPKVPDFPFQYNSVWEIGGKKYDSNIGAEIKKEVDKKFDAIDSESEVEIFHDPLDKQVTKLPNHSNNDTKNKDTLNEGEPSKKVKENKIHITNSDRFVMLPRASSDVSLENTDPSRPENKLQKNGSADTVKSLPESTGSEIGVLRSKRTTPQREYTTPRTPFNTPSADNDSEDIYLNRKELQALKTVMEPSSSEDTITSLDTTNTKANTPNEPRATPRTPFNTPADVEDKE